MASGRQGFVVGVEVVGDSEDEVEDVSAGGRHPGFQDRAVTENWVRWG